MNIYKSTIKQCLLLAISLIFNTCKSEIPVLEAKNLYTVVNPKYGYLSPIQGMVWFKSGMIETMYSYGDKSDATIQLIKEFFYLFNDGTFDATRVPAQLKGTGKSAAFFSPRIIATIINWLENNSTKEKIEKLKNEITSKKFVEEFIKNHSEFPKEGNFIRNLQKIFKLICDSYKETLEENPNQQYTTHNILLALLWKKSTNKNDFISYFKSFAESKDGIEILDPKYKENFVSLLNNNYSINEIDQFREQLKEKSSEQEINIMLQNYEIALVTLARKTTLKTHSKQIFEEFIFSDCGEASLLNFFILTLYNGNKNIFDLAYLEHNKLQPSQKLKDFFSKYKNYELIESTSVRNDWIKTVSELPNVTYFWPKFGTIQEGGRCEIKAIGVSQIVNSLRALTGVNSFDELVEKLSRENFNLSYKSDNPNAKFQTLTFYLNGDPYFIWHINQGHFYIEALTNKGISKSFYMQTPDMIKNLAVKENKSYKDQSLIILLISMMYYDPSHSLILLLRTLIWTAKASYTNQSLVNMIKKFYFEKLNEDFEKMESINQLTIGLLPSKNKSLENFIKEEKSKFGTRYSYQN